MNVLGKELKNFSENEFSENYMYGSYKLFWNIQKQRDILGKRIFPSMAYGALARFSKEDEYSKHFSNKTTILSTALDWFTDGDPFQTWVSCITSGLWDGVGVYFDTNGNDGNPAVMFHTDFGRKNKAYWFRRWNSFKNESMYVNHNDNHFWNQLLYNFTHRYLI